MRAFYEDIWNYLNSGEGEKIKKILAIGLHNDKTGEIYSNLLNIHEVNIKHIGNNNKLEMQILERFFEKEALPCDAVFQTLLHTVHIGADYPKYPDYIYMYR